MVKLGDRVKDNVSNFKGIVISEHKYLNGCSRYTVQPKVTKDGKLPDCQTFDEPNLVLKKANKVTRGPINVGGPSKYEDIRRS